MIITNRAVICLFNTYYKTDAMYMCINYLYNCNGMINNDVSIRLILAV